MNTFLKNSDGFLQKQGGIFFLLVLFLLWISPVRAEDRSVKLIFAPPELEGRFSIGVYNAQGKLLRTLFAAVSPSAFEVGLNGYQISWDGKDDAGQPAPAGKYTARGYVVGKVRVQGEDFHFNDWVIDSTEPILERILDIPFGEKEKLFIVAKANTGTAGMEADALSGESHWKSEGLAEDRKKLPPPSFLQTKEVLSTSRADKNTWWAVFIRTEGDKQKIAVGQFGEDGTFLRELPTPVGEPPFAKVAANPDSNLVWILSEDDNRQILRALRPAVKTDKEPSAGADWEIAFERKNERCGNFGFAGGKLISNVEGDIMSLPIKVRLIENELEPGVAQNVSLRFLERANGGWIATAEGLPLIRVSEKGSSRLALLPGDKPGVGLWYQTQGGAVVEEYRIEGLENMAAFDVGEFDLP
ncbi:MAG: FlgD immunoglobulin-like domain containing protein [Chthoniobacterales bacterium]